MFRKHLKHYGSIGLGSGVVLLCFILLTHTQAQNETPPEETVSISPRGFRKPFSAPQETLKDFQTTDFYRTIIDNNLFRPLGWRPPRPREPYRLLGTMIPTDRITGAQAIIQTTHRNITRTFTVGDALDTDTTIVDIQAKQVTLEKAGQQRTLKLSPTPWIK